MNRVSDCHNGMCKPELDQIEEEGRECDFEYVPDFCSLAPHTGCVHVVAEEKEWCLVSDSAMPQVEVL